MKQNYLLIILGVLILGGSTVKAQVKERGFFIEMNAGYGANDKWQDYAVLTPGVGYQFNKYCALGVKMSFETGDWPSHKIYTPFFRCNYLTIHRFQLFLYHNHLPLHLASHRHLPLVPACLLMHRQSQPHLLQPQPPAQKKQKAHSPHRRILSPG